MVLQPSLSMPLLPATPEGKALLFHALHKIAASPGTDILGAAYLATKQLQQHAAYMKTILLVTDGEQMRSRDYASMAALLASNGVRLHAVGIGEGHDSSFLTGLTRAAGGSYCPVETLQQQSSTAGAFIGGCNSAVAFDAVVELHAIRAGGAEEVAGQQPEGGNTDGQGKARKRGYSQIAKKAENARARLEAVNLGGDSDEDAEGEAAADEEAEAPVMKKVKGNGAAGQAEEVGAEGMEMEEEEQAAAAEAAMGGAPVAEWQKANETEAARDGGKVLKLKDILGGESIYPYEWLYWLHWLRASTGGQSCCCFTVR